MVGSLPPDLPFFHGLILRYFSGKSLMSKGIATRHGEDVTLKKVKWVISPFFTVSLLSRSFRGILIYTIYTRAFGSAKKDELQKKRPWNGG